MLQQKQRMMTMERTTYRIEKMDCSAEEQLVRMQLEGVAGIERLEFDLPGRRLAVYHEGSAEPIRAAMERLDLGTSLIGHETEVRVDGTASATATERRLLLIAFGINAAFFVGEMTAGVLARSMGLMADSLDMLADALVYGLSLAAVGAAAYRKKQIAGWSGYFQLMLAVVGLVEVGRRFVAGEAVPDFMVMIGVAALALLGNVATLFILSRARSGEAHMQASWIFTSNDIKVNALVVLSGFVVYATASRVPDLIAGALIFVIVARGAWTILKLSRT